MTVLIVVDTETSALEPAEGGLVELAAVAVKAGEIADRFSTLVWPGRECLQERHRAVLAKVSGIDPLRLLEMSTPSVIDARTAFLKWAFGNAGIPIPDSMDAWRREERVKLRLTSFNCEFDRKWLEALPWQLSYFVGAIGPAEALWAPCVMKGCAEQMGAKGLLPRHPTRDGFRWPKLATACEHYGVPLNGAHRALNDALAAAELAIKLGMGV